MFLTLHTHPFLLLLLRSKIVYAFLARALEASALDAGHAVSGLSSMARMCSLPVPPALANKVYSQILGVSRDWKGTRQHEGHSLAAASPE